MCKFMGKELRENAPAARQNEEAGISQFLTHKFTLLSSAVLVLRDILTEKLLNYLKVQLVLKFLELPRKNAMNTYFVVASS